MNNKSYRNVLATSAFTAMLLIPTVTEALATDTNVASPQVQQNNVTTNSEVTVPTAGPITQVKSLQKSDTTSSIISSSDLQAIANAIVKENEKVAKTVTFTYTGDTSKMKEALTELNTTYKNTLTAEGNDYLWGTISKWGTSYSGSKVTMTFTYLGTAEQESEVDKQVESIAASLTKTGMSDLEKVRAVNDYVVTNTVYSKTAKTTPHHIYAYLKEGKAVCQAYALLTYRLLTEMGIDARYVVGDGNGVAHAWNSVKLADKWYHIDTTWNDGTFNGNDIQRNTSYKYFLVTSDSLSKDHTWDKALYPVATDNTYSYLHDIYMGIEYKGNMYYSSKADQTLYKMDLATNKKTPLSTNKAFYFEVFNDILYYANFSNGGALTSHNLTTNVTKVIDVSSVSQLRVVDEVLTYKASGKQMEHQLELTADQKAVKVVKDAIKAIKPTSKTFISDVEKATTAYTALDTTLKGSVSNYATLQSFVAEIEKAKLTYNAIAALDGKSIQPIIDARTSYDALSKTQKTYVTNLKTLTDKEIVAKNAIAAVNAIKAIDSKSPKFATQVKTARAAYNKVGDQKALVTNAEEFLLIEGQANVLDSIAKLNPKSPKYVAEVTAANAALNNLEGRPTPTIVERPAYTPPEVEVEDKETGEMVLKQKYKLSNYSAQSAFKLGSYTYVLFEYGDNRDSITIMALDKDGKFVKEFEKVGVRYVKTITFDTDDSKINFDLNNGSTMSVNWSEFLLGDDQGTKVATPLVTNKDKLAAAITAIGSAKAVVKQINKLDGSAIAPIQAARKAYDALSTTDKKYVANLKTLTSKEAAVKNAIAAVNAITAINTTSDKFVAQVKTARAALDKAKAQESLVSNKSRLADVEGAAKATELITKLNAKSPKYIAEVTAANDAYSKLTDTEKAYVKNSDKLTDAVKVIATAEAVVTQISKLDGSTVQPITEARVAYDKLTKAERVYVTNLKALTSKEALVKNVLAAIKAIDAIDVDSAKFITQVKAARVALDKTKTQESLVTNKEELTKVEGFAKVVDSIAKLNVKSPKYIAEVTTANTAYKALSAEDQLLVKDSKKLTDAVEAIKAAEAVVTQINLLKDETLADITAARVAYDKLSKGDKVYVTNLKALTAKEALVKNALAAYKVIEAIDAKDPKYVAQVKAARVAYDKAGAKQNLVTNKEKLLSVEASVKVVESITKLNAKSPKYIAEVTAANEAYTKLTDTAKTLVTNSGNLTTAITAIKPAEAVIEQISKLDSTAITSIQAARVAYDKLTKVEQVYVTNLKELTTKEAALKNVLAAIKAIDAIDASSPKLSAQVMAARAAYVKTGNQHALVTNIDKLFAVEGQVQVMNLIAKLNAKSTKYVAEVTAANDAYQALTNKAAVKNSAILTSAVAAIQPAVAVIDQIDELDGSSLADITAARAAYVKLDNVQKTYITNLTKLTNLETIATKATQVSALITAIKASDVTAPAFEVDALAMKKAVEALGENKSLITNIDDYDYYVALYEIKNAQKTGKWTDVSVETFEALGITEVTADNLETVTDGFDALHAATSGSGTSDLAAIEASITEFLK